MSEDFSRAVIGQSIARTCVALGLTDTSNAVVQSLVDIIQQYIISIGERSLEQAEISGRAHAGFHDVLHAIGGDVSLLSSYTCHFLIQLINNN